MITDMELYRAISDCLSDKNPNANTCIKLASYIVILDYLQRQTPLAGSSGAGSDDVLNSDSEFATIVKRRGINAVLPAVDEFITSLQVINPRLYDGFIKRIQ